jgi:predicted TIM-barrel fold metal-dependent hydrolase
LKGLRRVLHTQPDDLSRDAVFTENVGRLSSMNLTFDLCVLARQLPAAIGLVRKCPNTRFVLDHCGVPDVKGGGLDPWRADLRTLAAEPNVVGCKVSGLVAYADASKDLFTQIKPFVDHAIDCFTSARLMFGGDWPVCLLSCGLDVWLGLARRLASQWTDAERSAFFAGNAVRAYGLNLEGH